MSVGAIAPQLHLSSDFGSLLIISVIIDDLTDRHHKTALLLPAGPLGSGGNSKREEERERNCLPAAAGETPRAAYAAGITR